MKVLVTGGAGFIGGRLAHAFAGLGEPVTVLDDLSNGRRQTVPHGARLIVADIADPSTAEVVASLHPDVVIHTAGQVSVSRSLEAPDRDWAVNVEGTGHVVDGAIRGGAQRFVFLSSGGAIYGETHGATEASSPAPRSPYGRSKLAAEGLVAESGLSHGIVRLANVYGPGQRADLEGGVVAIFMERLGAGHVVAIHGTGQQVRDLVYIDDVVHAVRAITNATTDGVWNVGTGTVTSVLALLRRVEALFGRRAEIDWVPPRSGDVRSSRLLIDKIARDLDWRPRFDLDQGLRSMIDEIHSESARRTAR